jgi:predicted nucleic acid-binding protein
MATARLFKSANRQAVRIPKKFRMNGQEVEIFRTAEALILREKGGRMERGQIRKSLESGGEMIGGDDLWIAAHKAADLILVTNIRSARRYCLCKGR